MECNYTINLRIDRYNNDSKNNEIFLGSVISNSLKTKKEPFIEAFKSRIFILSVLMATFESFFFYSIYNVCKQLGLAQDIDEHILYYLTTIFAFINASSRPFFGLLYDKFGFKNLYRIFLVIEVSNLLNKISASFSIYFLSKNSIFYFIVCLISAGCMGGGFAVFPSYMTNVFGMKY